MPSKLLKTNDAEEICRKLKTSRDHERPVDGEVQVGDVANVSVKLKTGEDKYKDDFLCKTLPNEH